MIDRVDKEAGLTNPNDLLIGIWDQRIIKEQVRSFKNRNVKGSKY